MFKATRFQARTSYAKLVNSPLKVQEKGHMPTFHTTRFVLAALFICLAAGCSNQVDSIARLPLPEDNNDPGEPNNMEVNNDDPDVGNNDDEALECETVEDCDPPADGTNLDVTCDDGRCVEACTDGFVDLNNDLSSDAEGDGCECEVTNDGVEICDGRDNDCDGVVDAEDEDFSPDLDLCPVEGVCSGVTPQTICDAGQESCDEDHYFNELGDSFIGFEGLELDNDVADNNCDGTPDELLCERDGNLSPQRFLERQGDERGVHQIQPQLASNFDSSSEDSSPEETRFAAVWTESTAGDRRPGTSNQIFVAFFDIFGEALPRQPIATTLKNIRDPQIIWDGAGFMVAWLEIGDTAQNVMMRRFDESGQVVTIGGLNEGQDLLVGAVETQLEEPLITNLTLLPTGIPGRALVGWIEPSCRNSETDGCVHLTYSDDGAPGSEEVILGSNGAETMALATTGTKHFVAWRKGGFSIEVEWQVIGSTLNQNMAPEATGAIMTGTVSDKHISADVADGHFVLAHTDIEGSPDDEKVQLTVISTQGISTSQTIDISGLINISDSSVDSLYPEVVGLGDRAIVAFYEDLQKSVFASVKINDNAPDIEGVLLELDGNFGQASMSPSPVALARGPRQSAFFAHSFRDDGSTDVAWMLTSQGGAPLCIEGSE